MSIVERARRLVIAGGPQSGKTTLADEYSRYLPIIHADGMHMLKSWRFRVMVVHHYLRQPGPWLVEGVTVASALKIWLRENNGQKDSRLPCDEIIYLTRSYGSLTHGQRAVQRLVTSACQLILPKLEALGVKVEVH